MKSITGIIVRTTLIVVLMFLVSLGFSQTNESKNEKKSLESYQVESIDGIVNSVYELISAKPGERDWQKFRALFLPDARIISIKKDENGVDSFYNLKISDYIDMIGPVLKDQEYYEIEIGRQLDEYHNIASVFSTFQSTLIDGENITVKNGINSMQLVYYNQRWWIANVLWNNETKENLIPDRYKIPDKKKK